MKKRTKRKVYKLVDPIKMAMMGAAVAHKEVIDKVRIKELIAIDDFYKGNANLESWRMLTGMNNIAMTFADEGVGIEAKEPCLVLEKALLEAAARFEKTGKMGLSGLGLNAAREVQKLHDLQRISITRGEYEKLLDKTENILRSKGKQVKEIA